MVRSGFNDSKGANIGKVQQVQLIFETESAADRRGCGSSPVRDLASRTGHKDLCCGFC